MLDAVCEEARLSRMAFGCMVILFLKKLHGDSVVRGLMVISPAHSDLRIKYYRF